jgi:acid stress chaperone HdeB
MTKSGIAIAAVLTALALAETARAQVTIDVAKITCDQYLLFKVADPRDISLWLSGYYHGKRGITAVDQQALRNNEDKVKDYCRGHLDMPVMQAVETLLSQGQLAR